MPGTCDPHRKILDIIFGCRLFDRVTEFAEVSGIYELRGTLYRSSTQSSFCCSFSALRRFYHGMLDRVATRSWPVSRRVLCQSTVHGGGAGRRGITQTSRSFPEREACSFSAFRAAFPLVNPAGRLVPYSFRCRTVQRKKMISWQATTFHRWR